MDITPLTEEPDERACAALMAASDPWKTLGYDYEALLTGPSKTSPATPRSSCSRTSLRPSEPGYRHRHSRR